MANRLLTTFASTALLVCGVTSAARAADAAPPDAFAVGVAQHAFDHLGEIGEQADAVAASGGNIIYATGCGGVGYAGLPAADELAKVLKQTSDYNRHARERGIRVILGYVCATSIVTLDTFDKNWSPEFRARFKTPPADWRQQGPDGKPLPSWYGGQYQPACMNNPDWRQYETFIVRQQLESGHDGIFFDNPTVHPQGCYCPHCMEKFSAMLVAEKVIPAPVGVDEARELVVKHPKEFLRFRGTTGRDFLAFIREEARKSHPNALVTCNNSLNTPNALFAQSHTHAYNIYEMTKAEDLLVVEDMATQPRVVGGRTVEYGPTYAQLQALSRGKPVVANVLADADNHTPPNLVRLAMAEAAAHGASYLMWPTWPEAQRKRMAQAIRPQAEFQREQMKLLNGTEPRRDLTLFLPFRRWVDSKRCVVSELAAKLSAANIQYAVVTEDDLVRVVTPAPGSVPAGGVRTAAGTPVKRVVLVESRSVLQPTEAESLAKFEQAGGLVIAADEGDWMKSLDAGLSRSLELTGPPTVRAVVRDQPGGRTIVHLYNLAIEKTSSFDDKVTPASDVTLRVRVPAPEVRAVNVLSADAAGTKGQIPHTTDASSGDVIVEFKLPRLDIASLVAIE